MESDKTSPTRSDSISDSQPRARPLHGRTYGPSRRSTKGQWTPKEDDILRDAVQRFKGKNWKKIAECFKDRTDVQCLHRWQKVLNPDLVKGPWSKEEDEAIVELVKIHGPKKWSTIAQNLPGRIGKQCRERWHNHLNPNINKEAWTQEEELALIRAHQVYGNKWAELTKFLPGRSDNAIKNHWNSSVKKKLDSYLASGLLAQFQGLPNSVPIIKSVQVSSSKIQQSSEENSPAGHGLEMEEISQRSQGSAAVGGSQSTSDVGNPSMSTGNEFAENTLPLEWGSFVVKDYLPDNPSLDLGQDMSGQYLHSLSAPFHHSSNSRGINGSPSFPVQYSTCLGDMALATDTSHCSSPIHNNTMDGSSDSKQYQFALESVQSFDASSQPTYDNDLTLIGIDPLVFGNSSVEHEDHTILSDNNGGYIHINDTLGSPSYCPEEDTVMIEQAQEIFRCFSALRDFSVASTEQRNTGDLCYEPPRFPSFDIPFFSCDLQQSNGEMQQEYSPLGIRQLMMSSANCPTPFRLWGSSPTRGDDSPDAVLKSAAKSFTGTPSILRKRHRDMLSPLSEKRTEKKLESTGSFSNLARDFSRLEVMFNESEVCYHDTDHGNENKENTVPGSVEGERGGKRNFLNSQTDRLEKGTDGSVPYDNVKQPGGVEPVCTVASRGVTSSETPRSFNSAEKIENPGSSFGVENVNIFGGTPFRRIMESPSAWASPWFINSFQPGPRVDTEITVEDMEIFMSPGDRSYDALGLMKQLSEQTASAFAAAQEVLGNGTPKSTSKNNCNQEHKDDTERHSLPSGLNIMAPERRTLDFSECVTPGKASENGISSNAIKSPSNSSSYLLKGCR